MGFTLRRMMIQLQNFSLTSTHNLTREMQMRSAERSRKSSPQRAAEWIFEGLGTIRRKIIQRAGRLTRPRGRLTLTLGDNQAVEEEIAYYMMA